MDDTKRNMVRKSYNFRLVNIVNNSNFRKFGNHHNCTCKIEKVIDQSLNEEVVVACICNYCEWASCSECKISGLVNISCENEKHNTK